MIKKGQNLRLFFTEEGTSQNCFAAATDCQFHISAAVEDSSTKDTTGDWTENEVTNMSWDCQTSALVIIDITEGAVLAFEVADMVGKKILVKFTEASGSQNRTEVVNAPNFSGTAIVTDFSLTATNRQKATYSVQLQGAGPLRVTQQES